MPFATINGEAVFDLRLILPRLGRWTLDCILSADQQSELTPGTAVQVAFDSFALNGTVLRGGPFIGAQNCRIVGGNGTIGQPAIPFMAQSTTWRTIVARLLQNCGESLSSDADPTDVLLSQPAAWTVSSERTAPQLTAMCNAMAPGTVWRFNPDGTVWIGIDTFPAATLINTAVVTEHPEQGFIELGPLAPQILPGVSLNGQPVTDVVYEIKGTDYKCLVYFGGDQAPPSRLTGYLNRFVQGSVDAARLKYAGHYQATVVSQSGNTLTLQPIDSATWGPSIQAAAIVTGLPGATLTVQSGQQVWFGFLDRDPARPYVSEWGTGAVVEIDIAATALKLNQNPTGATPAVARAGDYICFSPTMVIAWNALAAIATAFGTPISQITDDTVAVGYIQAAPGVTVQAGPTAGLPVPPTPPPPPPPP